MHLTGSRSALYNTKHGQDAAQAEAAQAEAEAALGAWALPAYNVQRAAAEAEAAAPLDDL